MSHRIRRHPWWSWRPPVSRHQGRPVRLHLRVAAPYAASLAVSLICALSAVSR